MKTRSIDPPAVTRRAFEDAVTSARALPLIMLDTVILVALVNLVRRLFLDQNLPPFGVGAIEVLATAIVIAPMSVAVYRFVLLGEIAPRLSTALGLRPLAAFLRATLLLNGLTLAVYLGGAAFAEAAGPPMGTLVVVVAFAVTIVLNVRLTLLFPAIAREAPGATWPRAIMDTAGQGWRIFAVLALCSLPFLFAGLPIDGLVREVAPMRPTGLILIAMAAVLEVAWTVVLVIAAARMYETLGQRLNKA
jgi:hypothetical protein